MITLIWNRLVTPQVLHPERDAEALIIKLSQAKIALRMIEQKSYEKTLKVPFNGVHHDAKYLPLLTG